MYKYEEIKCNSLSDKIISKLPQEEINIHYGLRYASKILKEIELRQPLSLFPSKINKVRLNELYVIKKRVFRYLFICGK